MRFHFKPLLLGVAIAAGILACGALAAPLVLTSAKVSSGNVAVVVCDADGFTHSYTTSRGNVTAVTIGGLADPACEGATLRATITSSAGASIASAGPATIPTDAGTVDNSVTMSTSPQPSAALVAGVQIAVEGP